MSTSAELLILSPHPTHSPPPRARLTVTLTPVEREGHPWLEARFVYEGAEGESLKIPPLRGTDSARCDGLWNSTCFEIFLQPEGASPAYWEVNFAPRGDWNMYALDGYRKELREEPGAEEVSSEGFILNGRFAICTYALPIPGPSPMARGLIRIGATAVIETENGRKTYWALHHAGDKPDFHRSESFVHQLNLRVLKAGV